MDRRIIFSRIRVGLTACVLILAITSCSGQKEAKVEMKRDHIIINQLQHAERYFKMHPEFEKAFTFLRRDDLAELPAERLQGYMTVNAAETHAGNTRPDSIVRAA